MYHYIVPNNWSCEPVSQVSKVITGITPSKKNPKNYVNGHIPFFKPPDLIQGENLLTSTDHLTHEGKESAKEIPAGSVCVCCIGSIGKCGYTCVSGCTNQQINTLVPCSNKVDGKYLYYYCSSAFFQESLNDKAVATTIAIINKSKLAQILIPYPKLSEQYKIVSKIEELFSELDKGVVELQKAKEQLKIYRQAVLKDAFSGYTDLLPLVNCVNKIFDGPYGSNLKTSDYVDSGVRVVRLENIKQCKFDNSKFSFVTEEKYASIKGHTVFPSDVIMSTFVTDTVSVCQMPSTTEFAINKADCIAIRSTNDYIPKFLMYYLSSRMVFDQLRRNIHGATRPRVNTKQIKAIMVPSVTVEEQECVVQAIESRLSVCDKIEQTVDESLKKAESLRQSILKQAFEGKLVPQEEENQQHVG